jgi:hypothetical protein
MTTTETTNPYPEVRVPAGAVWVDEWQQPGTPDAWRIFDGPERAIAGAPDPLRPGIGDRDIRLFIGGIQNPGGAVHRNIVPPDLHPDRPITLRQAAQLGLALLELVSRARRWPHSTDCRTPLRASSHEAGCALLRADRGRCVI